MASMTNALKNMELILYGNASLKFSSAYQFQLLLKIKYFAFMVGSLLKSSPWNKSGLLIEYKISLIMDLSAIFYGQTQLIKAN